jgi:hypothetical protein
MVIISFTSSHDIHYSIKRFKKHLVKLINYFTLELKLRNFKHPVDFSFTAAKVQYHCKKYTRKSRKIEKSNIFPQHMHTSQGLKVKNTVYCILQGIMFEISYTTTLFILTYISLDRLLALYQ